MTSFGIPFDMSSELVREAGSTVSSNARQQEGEMMVLGGKYRVTWRFSVLNGELAIFVASSSNDSVYAALEVLDDVAAIFSSFGVDLTAEKIKSRYNEAFARINAAFGYPGSKDVSSLILGHRTKKAIDGRDTEVLRHDARALMKLRHIDTDLELVSSRKKFLVPVANLLIAFL